MFSSAPKAFFTFLLGYVIYALFTCPLHSSWPFGLIFMIAFPCFCFSILFLFCVSVLFLHILFYVSHVDCFSNESAANSVYRFFDVDGPCFIAFIYFWFFLSVKRPESYVLLCRYWLCPYFGSFLIWFFFILLRILYMRVCDDRSEWCLGTLYWFLCFSYFLFRIFVCIS